MKDAYLSIAGEARAVYRDRGSRFIGIVIPVGSEEEIRENLERFRKEFHDARHHCYAYRLGPDGLQWRVNDDGEPAGSAGKPILGQLLSAGVSDVLALVVRYFGGTKLGVPGLIQAYKTSVREALSDAGMATKVLMTRLRVEFGFEQMNPVMKCLKEISPEIIKNQYDTQCMMEIRVRASLAESCMDRLNSLEGVKCRNMDEALALTKFSDN
ncbi:MAG TPA: YigZ family protein [Bacteroidales bacterium]|nr:YigZ family protein [Bacteroidales bacterium]HRZ49381.1 YigZ family protein [Bacteroidales bacterium]